MGKRERAEQRESRSSVETEDITANPDTIAAGKRIEEDIDRLLDEIDEVLEENAREFVRSYIQQGGE